MANFISAMVIGFVFIQLKSLITIYVKKKAQLPVMVFKDGKWTTENNHVLD